MNPLPWIGLVAAGMIAGASVAGLLVVRRAHEPLAVATGGAGLVFTSVAVWQVVDLNHSTSVVLATALIGCGSFIGGFGLVSAFVSSHRRCNHNLTSSLHARGGDPVVVILADVEASAYCPGDIAGEIQDLTEAGIPETGIGTTPFIYAAQKARYRAVGDSSPELSQARAVCERVEALLGDEGYGAISLLRCVDGTALAAVVSSAIEAGHHSIIVATMHVAESFRVDREKGGVDALRLGTESVSLAYTQPLWSSDELAQLVVDRVLEVTPQPEMGGVALVMHGQPADRQRTHAAFDVQENAFVNRVRMMLTEAGLPAERIRPCWQDWHTPDVTETVRHLAALGSTRIVVSPACFPFENLSILLDLPVAIRQTRVSEDVNVIQVAPWRDDEVFAEVLAEQIRSVAKLASLD